MELVYKFKKIKREVGYRYVIKYDEEGMLEVWKIETESRGRPLGSVTYQDKNGNPIGVYEWRKQNSKEWYGQNHEKEKIKKERELLKKLKEKYESEIQLEERKEKLLYEQLKSKFEKQNEP
jgi:hypothetical protein